MRQVKLLALAALAMFALGSIVPAMAGAEEESPAILCLEAKCAKALELKVSGGETSLITLSGATITSKKAEMVVKGCEPVGVEEKDVSLCKDIALDLSETKKGMVGCRSEAANSSDKDGLETVLALLDLHLAAEESVLETLEPLFLAKVLGPLLENELTINCAMAKSTLRGTFACLLLPGLTEVGTGKDVEFVCKVTPATHDPETGTCTVLCNLVKEFPFEEGTGKAFEDAWFLLQLKGRFTKDVFIDD